MAYTRISTGDVARACDKFKVFYDKQQQEKIKKRKIELITRRFWPLSVNESIVKATNEIKNEEKCDDYIIYEQLKSISSVSSPSGFIILDSYEADFIYRMRKLRNE